MRNVLTIGFYLLSLLTTSLDAHARSREEQAKLTELSFNFARLTRWPSQNMQQATTFNLCVLGNNGVQQSFARAKPQTLNHKVVQIFNLSYQQDLSTCHLVYISELEQAVLRSVVLKLKNKPILTIGEGVAFIQAGGMVGFESVHGKVQLNINLAILQQAKLVVSSRLLKLGKIFRYPYPQP